MVFFVVLKSEIIRTLYFSKYHTFDKGDYFGINGVIFLHRRASILHARIIIISRIDPDFIGIRKVEARLNS